MNRSSDPVQPLPDTKGTRRIAPLAGALALTLLPLGQANALLTTPDFTATQQVTINGEYLPPGSFDIVPTSDSYSGSRSARLARCSTLR